MQPQQIASADSSAKTEIYMDPEPFRSANGTLFCLDFIVPEEYRPTLSDEAPKNSIPIIDMKDDDQQQGSSLLAQNVSKACEQLGLFHVINHGIPQDPCDRMLNALREFFQLPYEERAQFFTKDPTQLSQHVKILNYYIKVDDQKNIAMWSETLSHPWHPTEDIAHLLPGNPTQYRDVFAEYSRAIGSFTNKFLGLMSQGLGLEKDCLVKRIGEKPDFYCHGNYYPSCPEPELTLGLKEHCDITALTVLLQPDGVTGLHVKQDGNWVPVDPVPGALVITVPDQMEVLSNGRYKSAVHRAVTNKGPPRASLAMFYAPNDETEIGPIEDLVDKEHPAIYKSYKYKEYMEEFYKQAGKTRRVKEHFQIK